ncbi:hypothetical protein ACKKBG_A37895 [Auxenochlorella protothecoides x Auxenochlorella symbiontica]
MYFPYGFPQCLDAGEVPPSERLVDTTFTDQHLLLTYSSRIQAWSAGRHRIRVGEVVVSPTDLEDEGEHVAAAWCQSRRRLALVTSRGYLHIYAVSSSKEVLWQTAGEPPAKLTNIYIQNSVFLGSDEDPPVGVVVDVKSILVVLASGKLQNTDWNGRTRGSVDLFDPSRGVSARRSDSLRAPPSRASSSCQSVAALLESTPPRASDGHAELVAGVAQPLESGSVHSVAHSPNSGLLALVLRDGRVVLARSAESTLHPVEKIYMLGPGHVPGNSGQAATCAAFDPVNATLAVGCAGGQVALYALAELLDPGVGVPAPVRTLSQDEWGLDPNALGAAACLRWSPDGRALAVGQARAGLSVWTASGCRVLCTLRQHAGVEPGILEGPVTALAWARHGARLLAAEGGSPQLLQELRFARTLAGDHRAILRRRWTGAQASGSELPPWLDPGEEGAGHALLAEDRVLLVGPCAAVGRGARGLEPRPELALEHLQVPEAYLEAAYPLVRAAVDPASGDVAVAGGVGIALHSRSQARWRLFGDAAQERSFQALALVWLGDGVVGVVAGPPPGSPDSPPRLELHAKARLDRGALLATLDLEEAPLAADALGRYVLLGSGALDVRLVRYTPAERGGGAGRLEVVRHLSLMSGGRPLRELALVEPAESATTSDDDDDDDDEFVAGETPPDAVAPDAAGDKPAAAGLGATPLSSRGEDGLPLLSVRVRRPASRRRRPRPGQADAHPGEALLLRVDGALSRLDLDAGAERALASEVDRFWLPLAVDTAASGLAAGGARAVGAGPGGARTAAGGASAAPGATTASEVDLLHLDDPSSSEGAPPPGPHPPPRVRRAGTTPGAVPATELPWWLYGPGGMRLAFPSALDGAAATPGPGWMASPGSGPGREAGVQVPRDPGEAELAFDAGTYPLGICLADVSVVGVAQHSAFPAATARVGAGGATEDGGAEGGGAAATTPAPSAPPPCFQPLPGSQPALHCLLHRQLAGGRGERALALARWYAAAPHFPRSAEWLLFTALEGDERERAGAAAASPPASARWPGSARGARRAGPTLRAAVDMLAAFPALYAGTVVAVARKTDAALWPALFAAVGSPFRLAQSLLDQGAPEKAAACLLVINHLEGPGTAQNLAVQVVREAVRSQRYALAAEAIRFLTPPGEEGLLQAVGLVGRQGAAGVAAARRASLAGAGGRGPDGTGTPGAGLAGWLWSWWGGAGEAGGAGTARAAGPSDAAPPTLERSSGAAPAPLRRHSSSRQASASLETLDSLTPLVDVWDLLAGHARALVEDAAYARLAGFSAALRALPGTSLATLLGGTGGAVDSGAGLDAERTLRALRCARRDRAALGDAAAAELARTLWGLGAADAAGGLALATPVPDVARALAAAHPAQWAALLQVAPVLRAALGAPGEGEGGGSEVGGAVTADGDGAPGAPGSR